MFSMQKPQITRRLDPSKPFIVLNFKTYKESTGQNAIKLARIAEKVQEKTGLNFMVCCQAIDLKDVASTVKIPVYAQHADSDVVGKSTGAIVLEHVRHMNIQGSLLNHSEKRIIIKEIEKTVIRLKELDMVSIVCAKDYIEAKKIAGFKLVKPSFIAIEPPELIGGEVSVSEAKPDVIQKSVKACGNVNVLVGAGIKNNNDLKIALKHGVKGVLLASHFVLATDPEKFLLDLVKDVV
jgi:triosephosphate isomerase